MAIVTGYGDFLPKMFLAFTEDAAVLFALAFQVQPLAFFTVLIANYALGVSFRFHYSFRLYLIPELGYKQSSLKAPHNYFTCDFVTPPLGSSKSKRPKLKVETVGELLHQQSPCLYLQPSDH